MRTPLGRFLQAADTWASYSRLILKSMFAFRVDAVLRTVAVFVREIGNVAVVWLLLGRFTDLGGWNLSEMLFLFSFLFLSYSLLIACFTGFRDFEHLVHNGEFDRYLLRPRGLMFQVLASSADWLASFGQGAVGVVLFIVASSGVNIQWTMGEALTLAVLLVSGVLIQGGVWVIFSSCNLWFPQTGNLFGLLYYNTRRFAAYPLTIFPLAVQGFLVFVVPFAFVNYFPARYFLRKMPPGDIWWQNIVVLSPAIAIAVFGLAYLFWRVSTRHYASTGN